MTAPKIRGQIAFDLADPAELLPFGDTAAPAAVADDAAAPVLFGTYQPAMAF